MEYVDEALGPRFAPPPPEEVLALSSAKEKAARALNLTDEEKTLLFGPNGDPNT